MNSKVEKLLCHEGWRRTFGYGKAPVACAGDVETPAAPFAPEDIAVVEAHSEGENGGERWIAFGHLRDKRWFYFEVGCTYSGWAFRSGECLVSNDKDHLVRYGLTDDARDRLKVELTVDPAVCAAAKKAGVAPHELDRLLRQQRKQAVGVLDEWAHHYASNSLGRGYWTSCGQTAILTDVLKEAQQAPMPKHARERIQEELERELTEEEVELFLVLYRTKLYVSAPRGKQRIKCLCGRWQWGVWRETCIVCGATLCFYCKKEPIPAERKIVTCPGCIGRLPLSWRKLVDVDFP